jgi:transposase
LREEKAALAAAFAEASEQLAVYKERLGAAEHALYGRSSEKHKPEKPIASITREVERHRPRDPQKLREKRRATVARKKDQPTVDVPHPAPTDQCHCPKCGDGPEQFQVLGSKSTIVYRYVPARLARERHVRETKICHCGATIVTDAPPAHFGEFSHELVANAIVGKTGDSMPIARQARAISRTMGFNLPRQTLNRLFLKAGRVLAPLALRVLALIAGSEVVLADETPIVQQDQRGKAYFWTFNNDELVAYVYSSNRSGDTPVRVLGGTRGKLVVDDYSGYNAISTPEGRERAGCNAHARRKFSTAR